MSSKSRPTAAQLQAANDEAADLRRRVEELATSRDTWRYANARSLAELDAIRSERAQLRNELAAERKAAAVDRALLEHRLGELVHRLGEAHADIAGLMRRIAELSDFRQRRVERDVAAQSARDVDYAAAKRAAEPNAVAREAAHVAL